MQGTHDIIQMMELPPVFTEDDLLQRFRANMFSLQIQQIERLSQMIGDASSANYLAELDPQERQKLLMLTRTRQTELLMKSVASLEKQKEYYRVRIHFFLAENLKKIKDGCWKCFYKKFDTCFAIFMVVICLVAAIIANWIVQHLLGSKLNSQMVLVIIGICMFICIFVICCINDNHSHQGTQEPAPENPINQRNRRNQGNQQGIWRKIIKNSEVVQCVDLLLNGSEDMLQHISINQLPYLRNIITFFNQINYPERIKCITQIDQILLERYRDRHQRLQDEVNTQKQRLKALSIKRKRDFQCDVCRLCKLSSHASIFCALSGLIAIGITEATAFSSSPLTMDWSPTWAIKILFSIVFALLFFQILYRNFRSKTPYNHHSAGK